MKVKVVKVKVVKVKVVKVKKDDIQSKMKITCAKEKENMIL